MTTSAMHDLWPVPVHTPHHAAKPAAGMPRSDSAWHHMAREVAELREALAEKPVVEPDGAAPPAS